MRDGAIYIFSDFEVIRSNSRFKLTDSPFSISFTSTTIFDQLDESFGNFPKEFFRFRTHEELVSLANTNTDLPDVMGQVCSTKAYRNGMTQTLERMLVLLSLESGEKVRLSAFDHATSLEKVFSQKDVGPYILLATNINPKLFG
ncbi:PREDICTED: uncharacterized protein LOC104774450, partial [Camelina sativa]|uniref:Uncharacterized protein LOC104774450 n=1 Tax=Camelina sativa TaxID=90675 RepID=A0ABM0Y8X2_CAMSA